MTTPQDSTPRNGNTQASNPLTDDVRSFQLGEAFPVQASVKAGELLRAIRIRPHDVWARWPRTNAQQTNSGERHQGELIMPPNTALLEAIRAGIDQTLYVLHWPDASGHITVPEHLVGKPTALIRLNEEGLKKHGVDRAYLSAWLESTLSARPPAVPGEMPGLLAGGVMGREVPLHDLEMAIPSRRDQQQAVGRHSKLKTFEQLIRLESQKIKLLIQMRASVSSALVSGRLPRKVATTAKDATKQR